MEHPERCFVLITKRKINNEYQGEVGIVKWGESGYYWTNWPDTYTQEDVGQ